MVNLPLQSSTALLRLQQDFIAASKNQHVLDISDLKKGKRGAIAKAISIVENDPIEARKLLKKIYKETGNASIIGITGPAGAGKSSLINKTSVALKKLRTKPAVLAIDPTSHVTGGAILGDRVRMTESTDSGTYIRSIASRGATGAVSRSLRNSIRILEYAGFNPIIIESVGAGQTEVEISNIADITVVVFNPNTGDSIQTIKAGLTEIGDIYLVNKSDLDGANQLFDAVREYVGSTEKNIIFLKTSVKKNTGISEFAKTLKDMMSIKNKNKKEKDMLRLENELKDLILNNMSEKIELMLESDKTFSKYLKQIQSKKMDPFEAADKITKSLIK
jgi:LAO/AO transport system kinase